MRNTIRATAAGLLLMLFSGSVVLAAGDTADRKDFQVLKDIQKSVDRYAQFSIFDDLNASVKDGVVTLTGKVTMPYKKDDIEKRIAKIDGVRSVRDQICGTGSPGRSMVTRISGTTRSCPTRRFTSSSSTAASR
jgi:hypothetical protein